jgi:hypothetical protein
MPRMPRNWEFWTNAPPFSSKNRHKAMPWPGRPVEIAGRAPTSLPMHVCAATFPAPFHLSPAFVRPRRRELLASIDRAGEERGKNLITQQRKQIGLDVPYAGCFNRAIIRRGSTACLRINSPPKVCLITLAYFPQMHHGRLH